MQISSEKMFNATAATTTTTTNESISTNRRSGRTNGIITLLRGTVIMALMANLFLSVDAIRCHQCNSHLDEDCVGLRLSTPRAPRDNQYLKECDIHGPNGEAFCRKTVVKIDVTGEHRIVRSCGWNADDLRDRKNICFSADDEGLQREICACHEDGCNAAPNRAPSVWLLSFGGLGLFLVSWVCRRAAVN